MPETPAASTSLDQIAAAFGLAPHEVQVFDPAYPRFDAQRPLIVLRAQAEAARPSSASATAPTSTPVSSSVVP